MKIAHIVNKTPTGPVLDVIEAQKISNEVEVINIDVAAPEYDKIIDKVMNSDRVISWSNVYGAALQQPDES